MRNPVRTADSLDISVGVTVDLELSESAGGHVKCWQRLAEAATSFRSIDLTVYFLGAKEEVIALSDRVRYRTVVPRRATRSIGIRSTPGHTDIAQRNAKIETLLPAHDVLHMTGPFALSGSAQWTSTIMKKPLAASIHTDNAAYARLCTAGIVADYFGGNRIIRAACERLGLSRLSERAMTRREVKRWSGADHIFYSNESQQLCLRSRFGETPRSRLRRGVDSVLFTPKARVALSSLVSGPAQLSRLQLSSLHDVNTLPTWSDVFREDLLPVWRRLSMNELWTDNLDRVVDRFEAAAT